MRPSNLHRQIHVQVIAAVLCAGAGNLAPEIPDKAEAVFHQFYYILRSIVPCQQQIEAGAAAHGAKVDHLFLPGRLISQIGSRQMLDGVNLRCIQHRLIVGLGKPQVEGRHRLSADLILPGNIQSRLQFNMINGKACNFFHILSPVTDYDRNSRRQWQ